MTSWKMSAEEHIATARTFLERSAEEFAEGDILQGSEKIWGAVAHATTAAAVLRGWSTTTHRDLVNASRRLAEEQNEVALEIAFRLARNFHSSFYGNGMFNPFSDTDSLERDREIVTWYVQRVLEIVSSKASR